MDIKNKCIICEFVVIGSFASQFAVCPKCGGDVKDCVVDAKDTIEIKYSPDVKRQSAGIEASGTTMISVLDDLDKQYWDIIKNL